MPKDRNLAAEAVAQSIELAPKTAFELQEESSPNFGTLVYVPQPDIDELITPLEKGSPTPTTRFWDGEIKTEYAVPVPEFVVRQLGSEFAADAVAEFFKVEKQNRIEPEAHSEKLAS